MDSSCQPQDRMQRGKQQPKEATQMSRLFLSLIAHSVLSDYFIFTRPFAEEAGS